MTETFKRTPKGESCYRVCRDDLVAVMRRGAILWRGKFGPYLYEPDTEAELHPRRDTVRRLIERGAIVRTDDANETQQECGMSTYRLA